MNRDRTADENGGLHGIKSQSWRVVKCSEVENWIVLFTGYPSEKPFKGSLQHHKVLLLQLSSEKSINIPPGPSDYCQYPRGASAQLLLKTGKNIFYPADRTPA